MIEFHKFKALYRVYCVHTVLIIKLETALMPNQPGITQSYVQQKIKEHKFLYDFKETFLKENNFLMMPVFCQDTAYMQV